MKYFSLICLISLTLFNGISQDLQNFNGLKSEGQIPKGFLKSSTEKYKTDFELNNNEELKKDFFLSTRFFIDELLQSGKILFNESLSIYLNKVANYALASEPTLLSQLQFYVIKSNDVNAFSTDQGIIFFTTGLFAQLENEAQLAYIILHEVSHFTEKHVQDAYVERKDMIRGKSKYSRLGYEDRLNEMSVYNKSNELEADSKGIDMYLKTAYAVDEIVSSFGVLLYSYLPFEDIRFDSLYFDTEYMKIPGFFYSDTINPITKEEDYDDTKSTHPNIKTRIDNSIDIINDRESQGTLQFYISEADFYTVRNLARFEGVRLKLAHRDYVAAIYDIYLLQKEFENNQFLDAALVKAFYGLSKYKNSSRFSEVKSKLRKVEGESYTLHKMIYELSGAQLNVMAYRYAYDLTVKYPTVKLYKRYEAQLKESMATNKDIDFEKFANKPYAEVKDSVQEIIATFDVEDSIRKIEASDLSKYQKIKRKKELDNYGKIVENKENNSAEEFHYFALYDLVAEENLIADLNTIKKNNEKGNSSNNVTHFDHNASIHVGKDSIVIVDPYFSAYTSKGRKDLEKSEKIQEKINSLYMDEYPTLDLNREMISTKYMSLSEVDKYNQLGDLYLYVNELMAHDELKLINSSNDIVGDIGEVYGTNSFLFSRVDVNKYRKDINYLHVYGVLFVIPIPFVIYDLRLKTYIDFQVVLIDVEKDKMVYSDNVSAKAKGNKRNIDFLIFHVLKNINSKEK